MTPSDIEFQGTGFGWHNYLLQQAAANPGQPGMITPDETLTYKQLLWRASKYAAALQAAGVKPGDVVVVRMAREYDAVAIIALSLIGAVSASNTAKLYYDFEPITDWLLTRSLVENYPESKQVLITPMWIQRAFNDVSEFQAVGFESADALARLVFTSGTTGRAKAVPLTSSQIDYRTDQGLKTVSTDGAILAFYDLGSAAGFLRLTGDLKRGQPYISMGSRRDPRQLVAVSKKVALTGLQGAASQLQGFFDGFMRSPFDFSHIEYLRSGGAAVPNDLKRYVQQRFGVPLQVGYGSTEAGYISKIEDALLLDSREVGPASDGVFIEVVDDNHLPLPVGETGVVRVKSPDTVNGYYQNPEATALSFKDGWFYPGDLGSLDASGNLTLGGRTSELINLGGLKLDPVLVDEVAAEAAGLNASNQLAAFGYQDVRGQTLLGIATLSDQKVNTRAISKALAKKFKVDDVFFMPMTTLPTNAMGKVQRSSLSELATKQQR